VLARVFIAALVVVSAGSAAWAQTPTTPPADPSQQPGQAPSGSQPAQPQPGAQPVEQQLQQFYPFQQPGRPPATPATPPSTTIPPWTPPVAPAPSQTNVPAPFPFATGGAPAGAPGLLGGGPGQGVPGLFAPTVANFRGTALEFHPTLRLSEQWTDNFFQTTTRTEQNFRSIFGPGFTLVLNGARTVGAVALTVDLAHDTAKNSGDDLKVFPSLNANVRYALTPRLGITFSETFIRDDAANTADEFGLRRGRRNFDINTAGLAVDWLLDQVALQAYYRNVLFINENNGSSATTGTTGNEQDTLTHILGLNGSTRLGTNYLLRLGYEFSHSDPLDSPQSDQGGTNTSHTGFAQLSRQFGLFTSGGVSTSYSFQTQDSTTIWNGSLFGSYGLPQGLSLSGSVGYSLLNSDTEDNSGTISARLNASYRFTRAVITVGAFRDFRQTSQQGQNFGTVETRSYFGSVLYQITPYINLTLQTEYNENEPTGTGNTANNTTQKQLTYGASLNWQILRWLAASLQYSYTKNTGQGTFNQGSPGSLATGGSDFAENKASINFFATF